jgi:hypothetical protein
MFTYGLAGHGRCGLERFAAETGRAVDEVMPARISVRQPSTPFEAVPGRCSVRSLALAIHPMAARHGRQVAVRRGWQPSLRGVDARAKPRSQCALDRRGEGAEPVALLLARARPRIAAFLGVSPQGPGRSPCARSATPSSAARRAGALSGRCGPVGHRTVIQSLAARVGRAAGSRRGSAGGEGSATDPAVTIAPRRPPPSFTLGPLRSSEKASCGLSGRRCTGTARGKTNMGSPRQHRPRHLGWPLHNGAGDEPPCCWRCQTAPPSISGTFAGKVSRAGGMVAEEASRFIDQCLGVSLLRGRPFGGRDSARFRCSIWARAVYARDVERFRAALPRQVSARQRAVVHRDQARCHARDGRGTAVPTIGGPVGSAGV